MSRYWVLNGGTWDISSTTHWSASDGGAGGASVPGVNDDVFFNANSFSLDSQIVNIFGASTSVKSINFTGVTHNPHVQFAGGLLHGSGGAPDIVYDQGWIILYGGDITLVSGMTIDDNFELQRNTGTLKVTSAGHKLGTLTSITEILDDLTCFRLNTTNFNTNNHNIAADVMQFTGSPSATTTITLGSSAITINDTLNPPMFWLTGPGRFSIWAAWLSAPVNIDCGTASITIPTSGGDFIVGRNIQILGNSTSQITLSGTNWNIICPGGIVDAHYTTLVNSHASGGATFTAFTTDGCIDGGGNSGWIFTNTTPTVTTQDAINPTETTCLANGNIMNLGSSNTILRGFVYKAGTSGDPTVSDSAKSEVNNSGFTVGAYALTITGLTADTHYRVRAYAMNTAGVAYGATVQVKTQVVIPPPPATPPPGTPPATAGYPKYLFLIDRVFTEYDAPHNRADFWVRFPNVTIPQGTTIDSAILRFIGKDSYGEGSMVLSFNASDNAVAPTTYGEYFMLSETTAKVTWNSIPEWVDDGSYNSPDVRNPVQEVINRAGWVSGNALMVLGKYNPGFFKREAYDYSEDPTKVVRLIITYNTLAEAGTGTSTQTIIIL